MREAEIIRCIIAEQKDRVIAAQLGISTHTVRSHLERIFRKPGVHTRAGVVVRVFETFIRMRQMEPDTAEQHTADEEA